MTNEQMIEWAKLEQASNWIWHASKENLDALIWIAQNDARKQAWAEIEQLARMQGDVQELMSYPGGLLGRRKNNG